MMRHTNESICRGFLSQLKYKCHVCMNVLNTSIVEVWKGGIFGHAGCHIYSLLLTCDCEISLTY